MLAKQRQKYLLEILHKNGRIIAKEVAIELDLSEDTIRRDLRELAGRGHLQRVHGGALPSSSATQDLHARKSISTLEKIALGKRGASLVRPRQVVFLDGGTTTLQLARHLDKEMELTVITHSPTIAVELINHKAEVQLIGGKLFKHSMVSVGAIAVDAIRRVRVDTYFMGVTGLQAEIGLTTGDAEEAMIKRTIAQTAAEVIVLASSEKLGAASPFVIGSIGLVSILVVVKGTPKTACDTFRKQDVDVIIAP
ncbi:MAG: DeoR/GlpR family DNA-binding transcription regulator [Luteolibacter sp.]